MDRQEAESMVSEFQSYQQQMQAVLMQKESLHLQVVGIEKALEELNSTNQKTAYKITGGIMVSKPVEELKKELADNKEEIEISIKTFDATEEKINSKLKELQTKLKDVMK